MRPIEKRLAKLESATPTELSSEVKQWLGLEARPEGWTPPDPVYPDPEEVAAMKASPEFKAWLLEPANTGNEQVGVINETH